MSAENERTGADLIADLKDYADRNTGDGRSDSTREAIRLIRAAADALVAVRGEFALLLEDRNGWKSQWAETDKALRTTRADLVARDAVVADLRAYLAKTLDNMEGTEVDWTDAEVRELITETLEIAAQDPAAAPDAVRGEALHLAHMTNLTYDEALASVQARTTPTEGATT